MYCALACKELLQHHGVDPLSYTVVHAQLTELACPSRDLPVCCNLVVSEGLLDDGGLGSGLPHTACALVLQALGFLIPYHPSKSARSAHALPRRSYASALFLLASASKHEQAQLPSKLHCCCCCCCAGILTSGLLPAMGHALRHLATPDACVIPSEVVIYAQVGHPASGCASMSVGCQGASACMAG